MYLHKFVTSVKKMNYETNTNWWDPADLLFASFSFGPHPAVVVEITNNALMVAVCTSRYYPQYGEENFIPLSCGEGGIHHDSFIGCHELHKVSMEALEKDEAAFYIGSIEDNTMKSVLERVKKNNLIQDI